MSETVRVRGNVGIQWPWGIGIGVWWFVWHVKGFWWGLLYGFGWPVWPGYHLGMWLWR